MSDLFNSTPDVPIDVALGITSGATQSPSMVNMGQRNIDMRSGNLFVRDANNPRIFLGQQNVNGTDFYGMKVSKPGFDVTTATNDNLIFNSSQDVFKIVKSGTIAVPTNVTSGVPLITLIPHGLSYVPIPLIYFTFDGSSYQQLPAATGFAVTSVFVGFNDWIYATTDATNIEIVFYSAVTGNYGTLNYKYFLLQESAA